MELRYHTPLSPEEQRAFGLDTPQTLAMADRVRFAELDSQNHVNNKAYLSWFEAVRVSYFDRFCLGHFNGVRPRILLHSVHLRYVREMLRDEDYVATARVAAFRQTSFTMDQQLWSGDLRARMSAVVVLGTPDGDGRVALPDPLRAQFVEMDRALDETA